MDPFPTKGIEYLLIIGYLTAFVPLAWLLSRIGRERAAGDTTDPVSPEPRKAAWFPLPDTLHLHRGHTWALSLGDRIVKVGMDDFAHRLIGEPTAFRLPEPGQTLALGETGWQVHVNGHAVDLLSPVTGEVVGVNEDALLTPAATSQDPYERGWLVTVRVPCDHTAVRNLFPSRLANAWMEEEIAKLSAMVGAEAGPVLQDGGVPVHGFARELAGDRWPEIAAKFLRSVA